LLQNLPERAKKAIVTIYQSLREHGDKASPTVNRQIISLLENPPIIFLTHVPWTIVGGVRRNKGFIITNVNSACTIKGSYDGRIITFLILFSVSKEAPNDVLNSALLHELVHIANWSDEETPKMFVERMARIAPEKFASDEKCTQFLESWLQVAKEEKLVPEEVFHKFIYENREMFMGFLLRNAEILHPIHLLKLQLR
jgi:hypothetical protein